METFEETSKFILDSVEMMLDIPRIKDQLRAEFESQLANMPLDAETKIRAKKSFFEEIETSQAVWTLIYVNIFSLAMAERHRIEVGYMMDALAKAVNYHYARVFADDQGLDLDGNPKWKK